MYTIDYQPNLSESFTSKDIFLKIVDLDFNDITKCFSCKDYINDEIDGTIHNKRHTIYGYVANIQIPLDKKYLCLALRDLEFTEEMKKNVIDFYSGQNIFKNVKVVFDKNYMMVNMSYFKDFKHYMSSLFTLMFRVSFFYKKEYGNFEEFIINIQENLEDASIENISPMGRDVSAIDQIKKVIVELNNGFVPDIVIPKNPSVYEIHSNGIIGYHSQILTMIQNEKDISTTSV